MNKGTMRTEAMRVLTVLVMLMLMGSAMCAQVVRSFKQHNMKRWGIPAGNYSGICHIAGDRYALVSDKQTADGWTEVSITFLPSGDIDAMQFIGHHFDNQTLGLARDSEGIAYAPEHGFFVCAENDQQILELGEDGTPTGRRLTVPACFEPQNIFPNYGFEALTYDAANGIFWSTTEQGLRSDVTAPTDYSSSAPTLLRLLSFGSDLLPLHQFAYETEAPVTRHAPRHFAFGVPELLALNDTTLLVMERELSIPKNYNRAKCRIRLFCVSPSTDLAIADTSVALRETDRTRFLRKTPLFAFTTGIRLVGRKDFANYEGMCLGPKLADGRQTVLLVADSQNRAGNALFHLKDYIKVLVVE